ncbi:transporter substrate-binding domain-containing protein [Mesorhizobium sp.]|uniref:substrate-binding periplasmic protein n=1 Tax=Mesorhizobium sp. TaxID=1871066 RepID=UPI000FE904B1|nr:transporter substrate-binding domain-containing protein [Mesorhizobium sp.]RWB69977.1 MAG: amino acid ABC transporter substrate-binding protein [Mesorhizobium sp.]
MNTRTTLSSIILTAAISGLALPAFAADCKPAHKIETVTPGAITVAAVNFPPYGEVAPDGSATGIDGDILQEIAKLECVPVKAIPVDGAAALSYVTTNRADLAFGDWYRTAARTKVMALSDPLYLDTVAIVSKQGIDTLKGLEGMTVGTMQGNFYVADLRKIFDQNLKLYPSLVAEQQDLQAGRLDSYVETYAGTVYAQQKGAMAGFKAVILQPDPRAPSIAGAAQVGYPMRKDNTALLNAFNEDIAELHKNGKIKAIVQKYGLDPAVTDTGAPRLLQ